MPPRFSEFSTEEGPLAGEKQGIESLLGVEIVVTAYRLGPSKYLGKNSSGKYVQIQFAFLDDNTERCTFSGSDVLIRQAEQYAENMPFLTTIARRGRCFTFT